MGFRHAPNMRFGPSVFQLTILPTPKSWIVPNEARVVRSDRQCRCALPFFLYLNTRPACGSCGAFHFHHAHTAALRCTIGHSIICRLHFFYGGA